MLPHNFRLQWLCDGETTLLGLWLQRIAEQAALPLLQPVHGKEAKSASQNCFYNCKVNNKIHYINWRPIKQILMRNILWDYNIRMHEVEMNNRYIFHDNYLWVKNWWLENQNQRSAEERQWCKQYYNLL